MSAAPAAVAAVVEVLVSIGSVVPVDAAEASLLATGSIDPVALTDAPLLWTAADCGSAVFVLARLVALRGALVAELAALAGSLPAARSVGSGAIVPTTRWVRTRRAVAPSM